MHPTDEKVKDANFDLKQAEETSLPNSLPNTRRFIPSKPNFSRTAGLIGAMIVVLVILAIAALV